MANGFARACARPHPLTILTLLACVNTAFADIPRIPEFDLKGTRHATLIRVIDGDTLLLQIGNKKQKFHLLGVRAPATTELHGQLAVLFLDNLLAGEKLRIRDDVQIPRENDRGERVGYLHRGPDGFFVNLEMIRQAYADVDQSTEYENKKLFARLAKHSKKEQKGIWKESSRTVESPPIATAVPAAPIAPIGELNPETNTGTVYATESGRKYHLGNCRYARNAKRRLTPSTARQQGLTPCKVCKPK